MFGRKKDRAKISDKDPVFNARFIGSTETFMASGKGCTLTPVQTLWDNAGEEKHMKKVLVVLGKTGMLVKFVDKKEPNIPFPIENISFCNADKIVNDRIFCWISRDPSSKKLQCYAVLCGSKERAQAMALVLSRAFQIAYKDWKSDRDREERQKHSKLHESESESSTPNRSPINQLSKSGNGVDSNGNNHDRKLSHDSNSSGSGFASSTILDPELEEAIDQNSKVHDEIFEAEDERE
ncbi:hypothetical protein LOTGIDRAFT_236435 [Lottia gigantea]|uniref:PID domain-containing protein n=1 Tax=Lottia gigantea TaxID=225164 RepID=V3ZSA6_LOTGI|nr:hypothetical protein LOTGIDRAFT_236435 [Lottia gigantea]ESO83781.1 hypothetical protein LOTGIDRAFT_236435 [Lottia gigantea]